MNNEPMIIPAIANPTPAFRRLASLIPTAQRMIPIKLQRNERINPVITIPGTPCGRGG